MSIVLSIYIFFIFLLRFSIDVPLFFPVGGSALRLPLRQGHLRLYIFLYMCMCVCVFM